MVLCDVTACGMEDGCPSFRGVCFLYLHGGERTFLRNCNKLFQMCPLQFCNVTGLYDNLLELLIYYYNKLHQRYHTAQFEIVHFYTLLNIHHNEKRLKLPNSICGKYHAMIKFLHDV